MINGGNEDYPSPDPLLLVTKKVVIALQKRNDLEIAAAAEPEDDYLPSELSIQAEEENSRELLDHTKFRCRNPMGLMLLFQMHTED